MAGPPFSKPSLLGDNPSRKSGCGGAGEETTDAKPALSARQVLGLPQSPEVLNARAPSLVWFGLLVQGLFGHRSEQEGLSLELPASLRQTEYHPWQWDKHRNRGRSSLLLRRHLTWCDCWVLGTTQGPEVGGGESNEPSLLQSRVPKTQALVIQGRAPFLGHSFVHATANLYCIGEHFHRAHENAAKLLLKKTTTPTPGILSRRGLSVCNRMALFSFVLPANLKQLLIWNQKRNELVYSLYTPSPSFVDFTFSTSALDNFPPSGSSFHEAQ